MAATRKAKWYAARGVTGREARQLERALCILADNEGAIKNALVTREVGGQQYNHQTICAALRYIVDGWENER